MVMERHRGVSSILERRGKPGAARNHQPWGMRSRELRYMRYIINQILINIMCASLQGLRSKSHSTSWKQKPVTAPLPLPGHSRNFPGVCLLPFIDTCLCAFNFSSQCCKCLLWKMPSLPPWCFPAGFMSSPKAQWAGTGTAPTPLRNESPGHKGANVGP